MILARHAIDAPAVVRRWPTLARCEARFPAWGGSDALPRSSPEGGIPVRRFSAGVEVSLAAARRRLFDYPRPLILATEHILLGLADAEHEVAVWLRQQGLDPDAIEAEIHQHYGHRRDPRADEMGPPVDFPPEDENAIATLASPCTPASQSPGAATPGLYSAEPESEHVPHPVTSSPPHPLTAPPATRHPSLAPLRVIDAAGNRAREGLRVVEDYLRFVLDDRFLTGQLKDLRHELAAVLSRFPLGERLAARETQADVGTAITTGAERRRDEIGQVLAANFTRLQEALRSLEEFAKLLDADASGRLKQLRYRTYTLQRAVEITGTCCGRSPDRATAGSGDPRRSRLAAARLYVLLDGRASPDEFMTLARSLVEAGVHVIQLRDKRLDDRQLLERAAALREITRAAGVLFIMNDRPDLAAIAQADGVHVGQEDVSVKAARTIVGPDGLIGVSTHSVDQARQAVLDGANYIGVGPTFPSETKHFDQFPGLELLRAVAAEIRLPAFAIGGIGPENLAEVLETGIGRIAIGGAIVDASDPAAAARDFSNRLPAEPGVD